MCVCVCVCVCMYVCSTFVLVPVVSVETQKVCIDVCILYCGINLLKPNNIYVCRTAALTSRCYILNIYSTNIHSEYFKHAA